MLLGDWALSGCSILSSITMNFKLYTFKDNIGLTNKQIKNINWTNLSLPQPTGILTKNLVEIIEFYKKSKQDTKLKASELNGYSSIAPSAFANNNYFSSIELSETITSIGDWALSCCSALSFITMPSKFKNYVNDFSLTQEQINIINWI